MGYRRLILFLLLLSCSEHKPMGRSFVAPFESDSIGFFESSIDVFSKRKGLTVFSKSKREMKVLSNGVDAFYIALYFEGVPIIQITNVGVGDQVLVSNLGSDEVEEQFVDELIDELVLILGRSSGVKFEEKSERLKGR
ncbi:hypothetical protein [Pseudoalteromonas rubra]|uniref:hypothetical protein n=1 Tax=Pseudoalteromonas rubra TaxID=43658 RepID=UPI002DBFAAD9|nr:hypothetical protein [Pseudoalteromonas rubra]MEC4091367.1 hypothetical protein [Pseudoalteromonas rubra]